MSFALVPVPAHSGARSLVSPHHPSSHDDPALPLTRLALAAAAGWADTPERAIASRRRGCRQVSLARHLAFYLAHVTFGLSQHAAAREFARHRASIAYGCRRIEAARDDEAFDALIDLLEAEALRAARAANPLVRP